MYKTINTFVQKTWFHEIKSFLPSLSELIIVPSNISNRFELIIIWDINDHFIYTNKILSSEEHFNIDSLKEKLLSQKQSFLKLINQKKPVKLSNSIISPFLTTQFRIKYITENPTNQNFEFSILYFIVQDQLRQQTINSDINIYQFYKYLMSLDVTKTYKQYLSEK